MATWRIRTREGKQIEGLDDATVRDLLYRHQLQSEDWAAPSGSDSRATLCRRDSTNTGRPFERGRSASDIVPQSATTTTRLPAAASRT